jgi:hypothetical protein
MLIIDKFLINSMVSMEFVYFTAATMFIFGLPNLDVAGFNNKDDTVITMTKKRAEVLDAWHRPYKINKVVMQYITLCPYPNEWVVIYDHSKHINAVGIILAVLFKIEISSLFLRKK